MSRLIISLIFILSMACCSWASAENISIGFLAGMTGQYSKLSQVMLLGSRQAVHECNHDLTPFGIRLSLVVEDDGTIDDKRTVAAVKKLVSSDRVSALLAWSFSTAYAIKSALR